MKGDIHVHTILSGDSVQTPAQVLGRARQLGLGALAIADHNSLAGSMEALDIAEGIIVVPAMEVTSSQGHILAYNITREIERDLTPSETIDLIHRAGGIAVAPHPYRVWSGLGERPVRESGFDAVEVMNGRSLRGANQKALSLAKSLSLPVTGGSDAHSPDEVGKSFTVFPDDCRTANELVRAILEKKTEVGGEGRPLGGSLSYGRKTIGEWLGRGMRRI